MRTSQFHHVRSYSFYCENCRQKIFGKKYFCRNFFLRIFRTWKSASKEIKFANVSGNSYQHYATISIYQSIIDRLNIHTDVSRDTVGTLSKNLHDIIVSFSLIDHQLLCRYLTEKTNLLHRPIHFRYVTAFVPILYATNVLFGSVTFSIAYFRKSKVQFSFLTAEWQGLSPITPY